ncbi:hypothetical protein DRP04_00770 [Archaeoglobales archaeon]|nr:MAG: hypothetical protein DRP04_00770 [Archaeoglobales archaeon]
MIEKVRGKVRGALETVRACGVVGATRLKLNEISEKIKDIVVGPTFGELEREVEIEEVVGVEKGRTKLKGGM